MVSERKDSLNNSLAAINITYNQPILSPGATWYEQGVVFVNETVMNSTPMDLFIDLNNTIYAAVRNKHVIYIFNSENMNARGNITNGLSKPYSIFLYRDDVLFIDNGETNKTIDVWSLSNNTRLNSLNISGYCRSLFIDLNETIYCSMDTTPIVMKNSFLSFQTSFFEIAAGNGTNGSESHQLHSPKGIFVSKNFSLFVADYHNNRIQVFYPNNRTGITLISDELIVGKRLSHPIDVMLDGYGYVFILDSGNNRIIGSSSGGWRCVVGCQALPGLLLPVMNGTRAFAFDSSGHLWVATNDRARIQKFHLRSNVSGNTIQQ